jgi:sigma-B regulation protein RsbU (phosphoserine phosphatase)
MENMNYTQQGITLSRGDIFFMYTDGVTEANNKEYELFSDKRLVNVLNETPVCIEGQAADIVECILQNVDSFVDGAEQSDDITILCLKYLGEPK